MSFSLSEYTKIDVGWGFHPYPHWGSLQRSPDPYLVSRGHFAAGGEWRGGREGLGVWEEGKGGDKENRKGRGKGGSWRE